MSKDTKNSKTSSRKYKSGYVSVNGLEMYYEIHGKGQPLVLLHGAFSAIGSSFGNMIPGLAKRRQVVGFDLQGHGRTADIDRPLTVEGMADDVAAALPELGIEQADVLGYSNGGRKLRMNRLKFSFSSRRASLAMVSNTMDDLPEPETPVKIVILRLGMRKETFFRLFSRAPRSSIYS